MRYLWQSTEAISLDQELLEACAGDTLVARLLSNRGLVNYDSTKYFINLEQVEESNPYEIPELRQAIERIAEAIEKQEKIIIYGDYDVDGTSSVALLYRAFERIGYKSDYYIPNRSTEGYGLNKQALTRLIQEQKANLIITCDCGISNYHEIEYASLIGLDIIVTDHHSLPANPPPSIANCNPKTLPPNHPLHYLPGVGVAYKLASALLTLYLPQNEALIFQESLLDLVALGIIADLASLRSENRYLVNKGLIQLAKTSKPGLQELLKAIGINVGSEAIGFGIAPRINAAGRLADANEAVKLMITEDQQEAKTIALDLESKNKIRQELCNQIFDEALLQISDSMLQSKVITLSGHWHHGVIGIVASRVLDKFHLPVFIIALDKDSDKARGSVRSINIDDLDIYQEMLSLNNEYQIFDKFGGHKMAAGFSLDKSRVDFFKINLEAHFRQRLAKTKLTKILKIDAAIKLIEINEKFLSRIDKLAPYGIDNPSPIFASKPLTIKSFRFLGQDSKHLKLNVTETDKLKTYEAIIWNRAQEFIEDFSMNFLGINIVFAFLPKLIEYKGESFIQLEIKDWALLEEVDSRIFARFQKEKVYNKCS